jgi:hypothetical protein
MADSRRDSVYEVILAPAASRVAVGLRPPDREGLLAALEAELRNGPNADKEIRFDSSIYADAAPGDAEDAVYTATPLSFGGYTVLHRPLTGTELTRLARQENRATAGDGYYVIDILPAETAFRRWPRPV